MDPTAHEPRRNLERRLVTAIGIATATAVVEVAGSVLSGSLALLTDAGHVGTDAFALGLSLAALRLSARPHTPRLSFGYHRTEVLAALANAVLLVAVAVYLVVQAYGRFLNPSPVEIRVMFFVGLVGLGANITMLRLLQSWARVNINARGAFLHAYGDTLGSASVVVAAVLIQATGIVLLDVVISSFILGLIAISAVRLLRDTVSIVLEATPAGLSPREVADAIRTVPGVRGVHDLHIWSMTSGLRVLTGHILVAGDATVQGASRIVDEIDSHLRKRFGIAHATLQVDNAHEDIIPAAELTRDTR